ncbi:hypothetical protein F0726_02810 [Acidithiobacillus caldus]|nr:hypothetical protein F0726_02810 [Acidithiobacillus caldus]
MLLVPHCHRHYYYQRHYSVLPKKSGFVPLV